jgi:transcriptional regulator with XRE-family HTH domain
MRFAQIVDSLVRTYGSDQNLADALALSRTAVREWRSDRAIPYVDTLLHIADTCGLDRASVLNAAGKPPLEELRALLASAPEDTLAIRLKRYRDDNGFDTEEAAASIGIDRWRFSRYANGSLAIQSLVTAEQLGCAVGLGVVETLLASGVSAEHKLVVDAVEQTSGFAGWLRGHAQAKGYRTFESSHVRLLAATLQITEGKTNAMLKSRRLPDAIDAQRIAKFAGVPVDEVLVAGGWDQDLATKVADGLDAASGIRREYETLPNLLRAYRVVMDLSADGLAAKLGVDSTAVSRWETGSRTPDVMYLVAVAEVTNAPLGRLFRAAQFAA